MRALWFPVVVASLGALACTGKSSHVSAQSAGAEDGLVVTEGWSDSSENSEPTLRWSLESQAAVIAVGEVLEPVERGGRTLLALKLVDVIKGQAALGAVFPENRQPFMGCNPPTSVPRPSELFPPGSKALIYLQKAAGAKTLTILQIMTLPGPGGIAHIRKYVALEAAMRDPQADWSKLLPADGTMDELTLRALENARPRHAGPALRAMFEQTLVHLEAGAESRPTHVGYLVNQLNRQSAGDAKLSLAGFERLLRWVAALEADRVFLLHWPACAPSSVIAHVSAEDVPSWLGLLGALRARAERVAGGAGNVYGMQGVARCYTNLPEGSGVPALLESLETAVRGGPGKAQWAVPYANFLAGWANSNRKDVKRRATIRAAAEALLAKSELAGPAWLTLRRHLDAVVRACR